MAKRVRMAVFLVTMSMVEKHLLQDHPLLPGLRLQLLIFKKVNIFVVLNPRNRGYVLSFELRIAKWLYVIHRVRLVGDKLMLMAAVVYDFHLIFLKWVARVGPIRVGRRHNCRSQRRPTGAFRRYICTCWDEKPTYTWYRSTLASSVCRVPRVNRKNNISLYGIYVIISTKPLIKGKWARHTRLWPRSSTHRLMTSRQT